MKLKNIQEFINEATEKKSVKGALGIYHKLYKIPPRAKDFSGVTPVSNTAVFVINCGGNCSQYTLKTRFGYSVLDMLEENKDLTLYILGRTVLFGMPGALRIGDTIALVNNDNYNQVDYTYKVNEIVASKAEWLKYLKENGFQVYPPKAFSKPTGRVCEYHVYSIKGIMDLNAHLEQVKF